jgi:hypothetical protein
MKRYVRAYWYDEEDSIDDFIYGRDPKAAHDYDDEPEEIITDDMLEDDFGHSDFDEYDLYDYSEYEDFYKQIKKRQVYVPARVAKDIPDYNAYRKSLFGTLYLSMQSGETIADLYNEICTDCPGILDEDAMNESDMLIEIVDATLYAQSLLKIR